MDKNAIKKYAVWARRELISRVSQRAAYYGITEDWNGDTAAEIIMGRVLSDEEKSQRQALAARIRQKGYQQVMEEAAYTWFNRFTALRFMEVNGYLPSHVRVFTDEANQFKPQILAEAINMELGGLDMQKVYAFKNANDDDGLFKYMVIVQCNALSAILPGMFQQISDYTELLFPDNLLREGSVLQQMIELIPEEDWKDAVQIIGWLYQYYNAEKKDEVFAALKKNVKITKENIPAATQLFTPDWIVRYMVENSLGRLWVEGHPNDELKATWKYYLEEAQQEPEVQAQLAEIRKEYAAMTPEQIKCIDPCCGSGHILAYLFDVLVQIYESYGYTTREAVASIVQNNLYGLDIDDRAAQLAYFAVMMKARQYDRRFFSRDIQPHVYAIQNSEPLSNEAWGFLGEEEEIARRLWESFVDAKEYGSLVQPNVTLEELERLKKRVVEVDRMGSYGNLFTDAMSYEVLHTFWPLIELATALVQKYDVVVTNPPYMGSSGMGAKLADFVKKNYPDSKSDLFAAFMERADTLVKVNRFTSLITMESWMFLSSFEKIREKINRTKTIINMVHMPYLGKGGTSLGINFGTAAVVMKNGYVPDYNAQYEYTVYYECDTEGVPFIFPTKNERWKTAKQSDFSKIPGSPVAYWISENMFAPYTKQVPLLGSIAQPCAGLATGNNDIFERNWYEVDFSNIGFGISDILETTTRSESWYPCNSGGEFRKWSTDDVIVVYWKNNGERIKSYKNAAGKLGARPQNTQYYFKEGLTWNKLSSSRFAVKYKRPGYVFDDTSRSAFPANHLLLNYYIGLLCSCVTFEYLKALNPTMSFTNGDLIRIPCIEESSWVNHVTELVNSNISLSKIDWDSFETSWEFQRNPLV